MDNKKLAMAGFLAFAMLAAPHVGAQQPLSSAAVGPSDSAADCDMTPWGTLCANVFTTTGYHPDTSKCGSGSGEYCLRQSSSGSVKAELQGVQLDLFAAHASDSCESPLVGVVAWCAVNNMESFSWHDSLDDCMWARSEGMGLVTGSVTVRVEVGDCP